PPQEERQERLAPREKPERATLVESRPEAGSARPDLTAATPGMASLPPDEDPNRDAAPPPPRRLVRRRPRRRCRGGGRGGDPREPDRAPSGRRAAVHHRRRERRGLLGARRQAADLPAHAARVGRNGRRVRPDLPPRPRGERRRDAGAD